MDKVASAHPKEAVPDPLAKNWKLPYQIVAEGADPSLADPAEIKDACSMLEDVANVAMLQPPPMYSEQGQTRGRKPKRSKLEKTKRLAGKKNRKNKKAKKASKDEKKPQNLKRKAKTAKKSEDVSNETNGEHGSETKAKGPKKPRQSKSNKAESSDLTGASPAVPVPAPKPKRARKKPAPPAEVADAPEDLPEARAPEAVEGASVEANAGDTYQKPSDCVPAPSHANTNGVYSSAYKRVIAAEGTVDAAREVPWLYKCIL